MASNPIRRRIRRPGGERLKPVGRARKSVVMTAVIAVAIAMRRSRLRVWLLLNGSSKRTRLPATELWYIFVSAQTERLK